ncbi:hypothetical protein QVD17_03183 [Tagetes erecta]|uniref:LOB domain-containing protein n=1 Tax=Tagetes erecta TaxID=13708 RepID=A0AAD8L9L1_TARER|nr:hypothetical protein QVD17_03183 [Tagetes erecta]
MSYSRSRPKCAACMTMYTECSEWCVFAPYFPPDQTAKFRSVEYVFGFMNAARFLWKVPVSMREYAVTSLVYEAEARIHDPIFGCAGHVSFLQERVNTLESELHAAKELLASYNTRHQGPGTSKQLFHLQQNQETRNLLQQRFDGAGPSGQHNQQPHESQQHRNERHLMEVSNEFNRRFRGAGPSDQATPIGQAEELRSFIEQLIPHEFMLMQHQKQPLQPQQQELIHFIQQQPLPKQKVIRFVQQLIQKEIKLHLQSKPPQQEQHDNAQPPQQQDQPPQQQN